MERSADHNYVDSQIYVAYVMPYLELGPEVYGYYENLSDYFP